MEPDMSRDALSRLAEARDLTDEHERYSRFVDAIPSLSGDEELRALFCELIAADPDRVMAESAAGAALVPGADVDVIATIASALHDRDFVQRRTSELATFDRLVAGSYEGEPEHDLEGASGWLEERLAEQSESPLVLGYLARGATRRHARAAAERRLAEGG